MTGEVRWHSTPGGNVADMNTQSVGVVGVVDGQRLWIDGNADGHIYALNARTGRKVWQYQLSKRGINVSPVLAGQTVYAAHSEENVDSGIMAGWSPSTPPARGRDRQPRALARRRARRRVLVAAAARRAALRHRQLREPVRPRR